ncbi:MAG: hypothetical protein LBU14_03325 [Candidatus Peribacteria bacterium]|nr:hypothetical protein [Candidatus Peribacteria bacterium]
MVDEFIEVHSNLFEDLKGQIMTPENKKLFNEKKDELLKWLNSYKTKANDILKDLKVK